MTARYWPLKNWPSESMINQLMKTIHLDRAQATSMAVSMLITQLLMVVDAPTRMLSESHGAA